MPKTFYIPLIVLLFIASGAVAQQMEVQKSDSIAKIDGQEYIIHTAAPKETLFSIARTYQVRLSRIVFDNPGVLDGLKIGQTLRILKSAQGETVESDTAQTARPALHLEGKYVLYTVPKRQTLYSIAKEYNTTVSAIMDANPELIDGLKVGATIRIPVPAMLGDMQTQRVEMVGLPDMVKKEMTTVGSTNRSDTARIALLLPLFLDENDTIMADRSEHEPETVSPRSEVALAFYEGFLLALDTLRKQGFAPKVTVIDTENRPWKMQQMIKKGQLSNVDLIIGPLYGKVFNEVAKYAYQQCIPILTLTISNLSLIRNNDYVMKMIPSEQTMIRALGAHLSGSDSTQNIIVHYGTPEELELLHQFRSGLDSLSHRAASFQTVNLSKSSRDILRNMLSPVQRNNIILLSNDEVKMASLMRGMSRWTDDAYMVCYVPNGWQRFSNIGLDHYDAFRIHQPMAMFVDYQREDVQRFIQRFRRYFNAEPSTFAFRGYDLGMFLVRNLEGAMENGISYFEMVQETGLQNDFCWKRIPDGGLENTAVRIVDYTDYQLKIAVD